MAGLLGPGKPISRRSPSNSVGTSRFEFNGGAHQFLRGPGGRHLVEINFNFMNAVIGTETHVTVPWAVGRAGAGQETGAALRGDPGGYLWQPKN